MATLTVDFEVWKEINHRRRSEEHSENEVLRELLGLADTTWAAKQQLARQELGPRKIARLDTTDAPWLLGHGVSLPVGTPASTVHKGKTHKGTIEAEGIRYNGHIYATLTEAAEEARGYKCNGWETWFVQPPGKAESVLIGSLRPAGKLGRAKSAPARKSKK